MGGGGSDAADGVVGQDKPIICDNQTYALCAGASCFVFNNVAYCSCTVHTGRSISSPFKYGPGGTSNICTVNGQGPGNGYMASTFSLPDSLKAPRGRQALYKCPRTSVAAYAKCDGGICFTSSTGHTFPGSSTPLEKDKIVCACPVERANFFQGLEIIGPYPCDKSFRQQYCDPRSATGATGTSLVDGTGIGSTEIGTRLLDGHVPYLNKCPDRAPED